jgi:hypothetical protein
MSENTERTVPIDLEDSTSGGTPARTPATFSGDQFDKLIEAIRGNATDRVSAEAEIHARAMKKQLHPENEVCPQKSVFNPLGERDHPRPPLRYEFFLGPYPLEAQTLLSKEIEYLNRLEPGTYDVTKGDGTVVSFYVIPKFRLDGRSIERITIAFPCADDDQKQNYPPFTQMLREVVDQIEVRALTGASR